MADALVAKSIRRHQFQAFQLSEVCRVAEHVDVQQLRHVLPSIVRIFFAEPFANLQCQRAGVGTRHT